MIINGKYDTGRTRHKQCTGPALKLANAHQEPADITLFAACYSPFSQRVWLAMELLDIPYKYYEINPYAEPKPKELLEVSPKGLVPSLSIKIGGKTRALNESTVILQYLEGLAAQTSKKSLFPPASDPYSRAFVCLQADHVNRTLIPAFYASLMAQDSDTLAKRMRAFTAAIEGFVLLFERAEREKASKSVLGLWTEDGDIGWVDVMVMPWLHRAEVVLRYYKGFEFSPGKRLATYLNRLLNHPVVKKTTSDDQLYIDSYEGYAFNRPNTSQVANAINEGHGLP